MAEATLNPHFPTPAEPKTNPFQNLSTKEAQALLFILEAQLVDPRKHQRKDLAKMTRPEAIKILERVGYTPERIVALAQL